MVDGRLFSLWTIQFRKNSHHMLIVYNTEQLLRLTGLIDFAKAWRPALSLFYAFKAFCPINHTSPQVSSERRSLVKWIHNPIRRTKPTMDLSTCVSHPPIYELYCRGRWMPPLLHRIVLISWISINQLNWTVYIVIVIMVAWNFRCSSYGFETQYRYHIFLMINVMIILAVWNQ